MTLNEFKAELQGKETIQFMLPNGQLVPSHFHVTEVGLVNKKFIDCGGKMRDESKISLQLWEADDYDHRLHPEKLIHILNLSEDKLNLPNLDVEVEYQGETISRFQLGYNGESFVLQTLFTDCLARETCLPPKLKLNFDLSNMVSDNSSCCGDSNCC